MRTGVQVAVIGAGLGGLSAAALLARGGQRVVVFEKGCRAGGKMNVFSANGFSWDTGPSLVTMPHVLRGLWRKLGRDLDRDLQLIRLEPSCRYFWPDQHQVDDDEAFWQRPDLARLLRHAAGIYDISAEAFLEHRLEDWWKQLHWKNLPKLRHLPRVADRRTLAQLAADHFADKRLRQYLGRFATYNGSSPYRTPAAFSIIPYVQRQFGSWYVKGGLYRIAEALAQICREEGVQCSRLPPPAVQCFRRKLVWFCVARAFLRLQSAPDAEPPSAKPLVRGRQHASGWGNPAYPAKRPNCGGTGPSLKSCRPSRHLLCPGSRAWCSTPGRPLDFWLFRLI